MVIQEDRIQPDVGSNMKKLERIPIFQCQPIERPILPQKAKTFPRDVSTARKQHETNWKVNLLFSVSQ